MAAKCWNKASNPESCVPRKAKLWFLKQGRSCWVWSWPALHNEKCGFHTRWGWFHPQTAPVFGALQIPNSWQLGNWNVERVQEPSWNLGTALSKLGSQLCKTTGQNTLPMLEDLPSLSPKTTMEIPLLKQNLAQGTSHLPQIKSFACFVMV